MCRTAGSLCFEDFLLWLWPESVFLVPTKRKADSGEENEYVQPRNYRTEVVHKRKVSIRGKKFGPARQTTFFSKRTNKEN